MDDLNIRLQNLPTLYKVLVSLFVVTLGIGYLISLVNLNITYGMTDGKPGLTIEDLRRAFYGDRKNTRLAAKIDGGSMEQYLPHPADKGVILSWIQDGAREGDFEPKIAPILQKNCIRCHSAAGISSFTPLTSYEHVMKVVKIDRGEPVGLWARVAHTHVQSIGVMFFCLGLIFSFTSLSNRTKIFLIALPYVALLLDFGTRFLAKYYPGLVYVMIVTGATIGISVGIYVVLPLYEMWLKRD